MKRIFLTLAIVSTLLLVGAFVLGLEIGDPRSLAAGTRRMLNYHTLVSVAALIFAALVHSVLLTYFMGTGRWLEETRLAYKLDLHWNEQSRRLKYQTIPLMAGCLLLLILNIPFGAMAVDREHFKLLGGIELAPSRVHLTIACLTVVVNVVVNALEYRAIARNSAIVGEVMQNVHRIRREHGLPT
jgi:hypothetical protein